MADRNVREYVDDRSIRSILEEDIINNPYSEVHTAVTKVNDVYPHLVLVAKDRSTTDYWTVNEKSGVFTSRQSQILGIIGLMEDRNNRPLLSAVVTQRSTDMVGEKYFSMVEAAENRSEKIPATEEGKRELWQKHLDEVYEYWTE